VNGALKVNVANLVLLDYLVNRDLVDLLVHLVPQDNQVSPVFVVNLV